MGLFDLFTGARISNPSFKLTNSKFEEVNPVEKCVFYLEGCNPLVKKGEEIEVGQVLGQSTEEFAVPVLSTVKGKVLEVSEKFNAEGKKIKAVVVSEIEESSVDFEKVSIEGLDKSQLLVKMNELALRDEDGKSLSAKLNSFNGDKVFVNVKSPSFEPNFKQYDALNAMVEEIETGKKVVNTILSNVDIIERPIDMLEEVEENVLVLDLHTLVYIGEAFSTGRPHMYEYLSVFGSAANANKLVKVKVGTTVEELFNKLQGNNEELYKVVAGGAIRGNSLFTLDVAISNNLKGILFLNKKEGSKGAEFSCIRCAKCLRVCPKGLNPIKLVELWDRNEMDEFIKFGGDKCIECGLCSYVCPSNIEIAHKIKTAKEFKR